MCKCAFHSLCPLRYVVDMLICGPCRLIAVSPLLGSLIWVPVAHHHQVELVRFVSLPGSCFLSLDFRISLLTEQYAESRCVVIGKYVFFRVLFYCFYCFSLKKLAPIIDALVSKASILISCNSLPINHIALCHSRLQV